MRRVVIAAVLASASIAGAQPDHQKASKAYDEGQKDYAAGNYAAAAEKFEAAYGLDPDPAYLFNIAQAYRLGNACAKASAAYRKFLAAVPDAPNAAKVKQLIEQSDDCAKKQPAAPPVVDTLPALPEKEEARTPPLPPEPPPAPRGRGQRIAGLAIGGAGIVGLGVAAFFTYKASDYASQREALCAKEIADTHECEWTDAREAEENRLNDKGDRAQLIARISWGVGGAALVGGVVLYLLAPRASERTAVTVVPSQSGAMAFGTFRF